MHLSLGKKMHVLRHQWCRLMSGMVLDLSCMRKYILCMQYAMLTLIF